jgi:hypothetical protein
MKLTPVVIEFIGPEELSLHLSPVFLPTVAARGFFRAVSRLRHTGRVDTELMLSSDRYSISVEKVRRSNLNEVNGIYVTERQ